ncbi:hypothetical protein KY312_02770, partial [Candidatus Woesearchaeota archaeon]|nr:hypothetical protein [Candidatus Woesearchaeota archaeon]
YHLLKSLKFSKNLAFVATLLFLISTPLIYVSNYFTPHCLFLFINLVAFYFFFKKDKYLHLLSIPLILTTAMFGIYVFITVSFLLVNIFYWEKHRGLSFALAIIILIFALASSPFNWFIPSQDYPQLLISDFGGDIGIGVSSIILAFFGFLQTWKQKYRFLPVYIAAIALLIAAKYFYFATIYLNIFIVLFAAKSLNELLSKRWELTFIKQLSVIVLLCTFLFSSLSLVERIANDEPSDGIVKSLVFLSNKESGVVFSHPEKGFWINYYAQKPVFIDRMNRDAVHMNITKSIYYSRDFKNSTKLLDEYEIKYMWIDEKMINGQVWTKPEQGLLFLFENRNLFTRIYEKAGIEIWEYHPEQQTI